MKIAFITNYELDFGGVGEVIYFLCKNYSELGHEVVIISDKPMPKSWETIVDYYYTKLPKPGQTWRHAISLFKLQYFLKRNHINIIHAHGLYRAGYTASLVAKNIPYIVTSHGDVLPGASDRIQKIDVIKRCKKILKQASAVTHLMPHLQEASNKIFDTRHKDYLIPNAIDLNWFNELLPTHCHTPYLLSFGRIDPTKGQDVIIKAYHLLTRTTGEAPPLVIAGSGKSYNDYIQLSRNLGLTTYETTYPLPKQLDNNAIYFCGLIPTDQKRELLSDALLFLFSPQPALWDEAFGLVQLEAMARKKFLIASKIAASITLQKEFEMECVTADDPAEWAEAIKKWLAKKEDLQKICEANFKKLNSYDWQHVAKEYLMVYEKIVSKPKA